MAAQAGNGLATPVIRVRDLYNRFGDEVVHKDLDLDVHRAEILGVVGGSGSGKSVLLKSIMGMLRPSGGEVRLWGQPVGALGERTREQLVQRCGVLFQQGALFSSLSVLQNVALPLMEHARLSRQAAVTLAATKIALVGLPGSAAGLMPSALSGGMVKRAALARAMALDPELLFLDEPTAGLDPIGAAAFDQLLLTLRDAFGLTVFLVTHDLDTLYAICDRVAVISEKRVLIADTLNVVAANKNAWVQNYFHGPRGRQVQEMQHSCNNRQRG